MTTYVVKNENTLGYVYGNNQTSMDVLAGDIFAGGHDPKNGCVALCASDEVRPATASDFKRFRVMQPSNMQNP